MGSKACLLLVAALGLLAGCRQEASPSGSSEETANQPPDTTSTRVSEEPTADSPVVDKSAVSCPELATWTIEIALEKLADEEEAVCAAIRLVQLKADETYLADPEERTELFTTLGLGQLGENLRVLGVAEVGRKGHYWSPWLIDGVGAVESAGDPNAGPNLVRVSADPAVFPHLIVTPERVFNPLDEDDRTFMVLEAHQPVRFAIRYQQRWPYVALVLREDDAVEAARFRWMPFEEAFHGPMHDDLPEPAEGSFRIDLDASDGLEPVGGKIPPPIDPGAQPDDQPDVLPI